MATAFMRWLETKPGDYDRGIRILTLGQLEPLQQRLVDDHIQPGWDVLEIGCGTGALTVMLADAGANVAALDRSQAMLREAELRVQDQKHAERIRRLQMDATAISEQFDPASFDAIVSSLVFSEMGEQEQRFVLAQAHRLLRRGGKLLILDEVKPQGVLPGVLSTMIRLPLRAITWLVTRTTSSPLHRFEEKLRLAGFSAKPAGLSLGGTLQIFRAEPALDPVPFRQPIASLGRLRGTWTLKAVLMELWALFFRILPPYPQQPPGLYAFGHPDDDAPLLVTGNYLLTVQRLTRAIEGKLDTWILVADSDGINVWCGGGGGFLTAERILAAWRLSGLDGVLKHQSMILPQLCANGVDGWKIRSESGWQVHWGPVRARDIPAYLDANLEKTDDMRWVSFPLPDRLEMMASTLGFYALMILIPVAIFWGNLLVPITVSLLALSAFYAITLHWLPGRDGLGKSVPLAGIAVLGMLAYSALRGQFSAHILFNRAVGLVGLSVFIGAELQGMSPEMRGEQANWGREVLIAVVLILIYWLVPILVGWR